MSNIVASLQDPGKKKWFIIGGGTVAAYLIYKFYKSRSASASSAGTPVGGSTSTDAGIDPTTGIPYSEEYGTSGGYGAVPSGLSFNAATGQFQPAASTIIGSVPYSDNSGQAAGDPRSLISNYLPGSGYVDYTTGSGSGGYYAVDTQGNTVNLTPAQLKALIPQGFTANTVYGSPPKPGPKPSAAVPV